MFGRWERSSWRTPGLSWSRSDGVLESWFLSLDTPMNQGDRDWLLEHLGDNVMFDEPMSRHTTFKIGGPVDALVTVRTENEMCEVIQWARNTGESVTILGAGSNLLVRDGGLRGLVLKLAGDFETIRLVSDRHDGATTIEAGAAVPVRRLSKYAIDHSLGGLNFALGIPGSVGGALRMNAGAWGGCMAHPTSMIRVLDSNGEVTTILREQLKFSYRRLSLEKDTIILAGQFKLNQADPQFLKEEAKQMQEQRRLKQPLSLPSAGSVFRNPSGKKTAGELIDQAGLKGYRIGDAEVSTKHANFIVNRGRAKAADVLDLIGQIQAAVSEQFGIKLEPEVTIVGQETGS